MNEISNKSERQMSLFDGTEKSENKDSLEKLRCFRSELQEVKDMTLDELIAGFNGELRAITFSYDIAMIAKLASHVQYAKIILGASFMVRNDYKTISRVADVLANQDVIAKQVSKYDILVKKMEEGNLEIHVSTLATDHRKLYLFKEDDGRTRVINPSANMTNRAWSGNQLEEYDYDDSGFCYDKHLEDFQSAWEFSDPLPYKAVTAHKTDDPLKTNPKINEIEETGKAVILQIPDDPKEVVMQNIQYAVDLKNAREQYDKLFKDVNIQKSADGYALITPKTVEKMKINARKAKIKEIKVEDVVENYPRITFDFNDQAMLLNDKAVDLHPEEEEIKSDINDLLKIFEKYDQFVGMKAHQQKDIYYKLLNLMFASPFFARLRCETRLINGGPTNLPLYILVSSSHSSTGKSFFIKAILKMMTGKKQLSTFIGKTCTAADAAALQLKNKGVPLFIDEIDNSYLSRMKGYMKSADQICEMKQNDTVPVLIFASNDVTDPKMELRKRMAFLNPEGTIPSNADQTAWLSAGYRMISRFGTGLYREYIRRMIPKVWTLIEKMESNNGEDLPDNWYPDIIPLSSETLIQILRDYDYDVPAYIRPLTWDNDFSENAPYIAENAYNEIKELYKTNRKIFRVTNDTVTIETGGDKTNRRRLESWEAVMPAEVMKGSVITTHDGCIINFNRVELEKRSGIKFRKRWFRRS